MTSRFAIALTTFFACAACSGTVERAPSTVDGSGTAPEVTSAEIDQLSSDNLKLALDLYPGIASDPTKNVFYSPYSVSLALAMTYAGASGETARQIASAMHFGLPAARLHLAFGALDRALASRATDGVSLDVADSLWGDETLVFAKPFLDTLETRYGAGVRTTSFIRDSDAARTRINDWVSSETHQAIPDLFDAKSITGDTRLVIVNALYFHATWETRFDASETRPEPFTRLDGSIVQATQMSVDALPCAYAKGDDYDVIELPYANKLTSMVLVVPQPGRFAAVEGRLDGDFVSSAFGRLASWELSLRMPKLKIHGPTFRVAPTLQKLGMVDAFSAGKADFSAMFEGSHPQFTISDVVQQAYIDLDEAGTTAAAATGVIGGTTAVEPGPRVVDIDRPFLFIIRDIPTNTALFVGKVLDPTQ